MTTTDRLHPPVALAPSPTDEPERVRVRKIDRAEVLMLAGAAVSSFALTWLVYERLTPLSGGLGFFALWYSAFLAFVWVVARDVYDPVRARDAVARVIVWSGGLLVFVPLVMIASYVVGKGYHALRLQFFIEDQRFVGTLSDSTEGGGSHAIVGTLEQVGIAGLIAVPLGILSAIYLNEIGGRFARPLRMIVDAMSAVPSIVAGLFIYASYILAFGQQQSGFAGSLALAVLFLPTVTRTAEVVLRLVPGGLREAALALGGTEYRMAGQVVLPTARSGLATAVILGVARVIGETAPLILTIGGAFVMETNPFAGKQDALPLFVFRLIRFPDAAQIDRAWTGALVLLMLVLVLFVIARIIGGRGPDHISRFRLWRLRRKALA
jgi:phosphate transport system permease protein